LKLFILTLILFVGPACICAQTTGGQQKPKRRTKVETNYNESKNETQARIGPFELWKPPQNSVSGEIDYESVDLLVSFSYAGKKIVTPNSVTVVVFSSSQWGDQFSKRRDLSVSADLRQYNFGEMELLSRREGHVAGTALGPPNRRLISEVLRKTIPFDDFKQISQSKKAEIKIGDRKFNLKKEHLEAFKNFVSLMEEEGLVF